MGDICYARQPMMVQSVVRRLAIWGLSALLLAGCTTIGALLGVHHKGDPSVEIKASGPRWLLIKNPRFGDVASEPEYVWVEEDKVPSSLRTLVFGKSSILAPPEIVAKYGPPPGGGQISPRQRVAQNVASEEPAPGGTAGAVTGPGAAGANAGGGAALAGPPRGLVLYVDPDRIVIDLTARDGLRAGSVVSLRRDSIPIVHPVTGEVLGELDQEVATGRVTEVRDKFSVVEIQSVSPGAEIKVKDRVLVR
jgi:hypothetical protein